MNASQSTDLHQIAADCVESMGDIFWDYESHRREHGDYTDPHQTAILEVERSLREVLTSSTRVEGGLALFRFEYAEMLAKLPDAATDNQIVRVLVQDSAWTESGAYEVLKLAQRYGTSILRNALALADAMGIEDGDAGF